MKLIAVVVLAFSWGSARAADTEIRLERLPSAAYEVWGGFTVDAATSTVWSVLTDYEGIPSFVSSMRQSHVRETREDGTAVVEQKATGGMFFLSRTVTILLEVRRESGSLRFEDIGRENFWRYEGGWTVQETPEGARVGYHLIAQPDFIAPSMIMSRVMRRGARELLDQVRVEILRRSSPERRRP